MSPTALISVDWGTSSFRAALVAPDGRIVERRACADGILQVRDNGFQSILEREVGEWRKADPEARIVMSGMIGSRQGWVEAPYVALPATIAEIGRQFCTVDGGPVLGEIQLVPGLVSESPDGAPDVMRGEETQIFGAMNDDADSRLFVLPGTHSKWVEVRNGAIVSFATFMSGEVFAVLISHSILGRLMTEIADSDEAGFKDGVVAGAAPGHPGDLLNRVFWARTRGLVSGWSAGRLRSYLSGMLIGAELAAAAQKSGSADEFTIIGSDVLAARYLEAAQVLSLSAKLAEPDRAVYGQRRLLMARDASRNGE